MIIIGKSRDIINKLKVLLNSRQKRLFVLLLFCIVISSLLETLGVSAVLPLVNIIVSPDIIHESAFFKIMGRMLGLKTINEYIVVCSVIMATIYLIKNAFLLIINRFQQSFVYNSQRDVSSRLMYHYLHQQYLFFTTANVAELQRDVFSDVAQAFAMIDGVLNLLAELIVCAFILAFLLKQDIVTTVIIALTLAVVMLGITGTLRKRLNDMGKEFRDASGQINKWIIQGFSGIKDVKAHNRESYIYGQFRREVNRYASLRGREAFYRYLPRPVIETIVVCSLLGVISVRIILGTEAESFIPTISVFVVAAIRMLPSINRIGNSINAVSYNYPFFNAVYMSLKTQSLKGPLEENKAKINIEKQIDLCDISFAYPLNPNEKILSKVNLVIPKNTSVAFVGPSGSGKTTLADVILGLIEPNSGAICVDGRSLEDDLERWHNSIGYIPQNIYLLDDTIRANVAFGEEDSAISDEKVWDALNRAQADEFVRKLKDGIYTRIGDRGIQISGGQRQRIGIARALYRDPELLVLDEATSALDFETESAVMDAIYNLNGTVTMIVIAHRLSTVVNCDKIYEVSNGKVHVKTRGELVSEIEEKS